MLRFNPIQESKMKTQYSSRRITTLNLFKLNLLKELAMDQGQYLTSQKILNEALEVGIKIMSANASKQSLDISTALLRAPRPKLKAFNLLELS